MITWWFLCLDTFLVKLIAYAAKIDLTCKGDFLCLPTDPMSY